MNAITLSFTPPRAYSLADLREAFGLLVGKWSGRAPEWRLDQRTELPDANGPWGDNRTYEARYADDGSAAAVEERVVSGSGNPHDGYGYEVTSALRHGDRAVRFTGAGYDTALTSVNLEFTGCTCGDIVAARALLRGLLGDDADRSDQPWLALANARTLEALGAPELARQWAKEGLDGSGATDYGHAQLAEWFARGVPGQDGLVMRLREAPGALEGWHDALANPPPGFTRASVERVLAQLCPFTTPGPWSCHPDWPFPLVPGAEGEWRRLDLGAGPGASLPALPAQLAAELTGLAPWKDWHEVHGEWLQGTVPAWRVLASRWARFSGGDDVVPRTWVTMQASQRAPADWKLPPSKLARKPVDAAVRWHFIAGTEPGDTCVLAEKSVRDVPLGTACAVVGSAAFQAQVDEALAKLTPYRWVPCAAAECFPSEPRLQPAWATADPGADLPGFVQGVLRGAGADNDNVVDMVRACRCPQPIIGYCEHRRQVLDEQRRHRDAARQAAGRRGCVVEEAAAAALEAAFYAMGERPDLNAVRRCAESAAAAVAELAALR